MKKTIIIGGGITGLSVAWKLSEKGYQVTVIESDKIIGGLARSIKIENYFFDIGPHSFFSEDKEVFKKVGFLSKMFTHNYGDTDYGLRAIKKKFKVFIASEVVGICNKNEIELWRRPNTRFFSRLKSFYKSKNFIMKEVMCFQLVHFGLFAFLKNEKVIF